MCPAAVNTRVQVRGFIDISAKDIAARLNSRAPGVNLTARDSYAIMHLCPFDTVAREAISPFCGLFSEKDFEIYEYAGDLEKFYNTGYPSYSPCSWHTANRFSVSYGNLLGAVQGVGYINELIARLTNSPARQSLQTNSTLLSSSDTFPLNRTLYVDFSHDNLIIAVFSAMGLFNQSNGPLDATKIDKDRTWITSKMVPFSGHMTVERISCSTNSPPAGASRSRSMRWWKWIARHEGDDDEEEDKKGEENEEYVRVFVNDARQPLHFCGAGSDGMCKLREFLRSQEYARNDGFGDFAACEYTGGGGKNHTSNV